MLLENVRGVFVAEYVRWDELTQIPRPYGEFDFVL